jgi:hypothetical protein
VLLAKSRQMRVPGLRPGQGLAVHGLDEPELDQVAGEAAHVDVDGALALQLCAHVTQAAVLPEEFDRTWASKGG